MHPACLSHPSLPPPLFLCWGFTWGKVVTKGFFVKLSGSCWQVPMPRTQGRQGQVWWSKRWPDKLPRLTWLGKRIFRKSSHPPGPHLESSGWNQWEDGYGNKVHTPIMTTKTSMIVGWWLRKDSNERQTVPRWTPPPQRFRFLNTCLHLTVAFTWATSSFPLSPSLFKRWPLFLAC